jgi:hypothetical protein
MHADAVSQGIAEISGARLQYDKCAIARRH